MENKTTFWKFIQNNKIEIPIIQRDYAQGREGKEYIRNTFLETLKKALDSDDEQLKLDFVYGSNENDKLNPLDGQQRLTTLWLLHWYIALKAGQLTDDVAEILNNFSYETRISSREFCQELCNTDNFKKYEAGSVVDFIQRQTWFYSAWKQDPTIQAMLRMLKGTKISDKKGNDICDGIEEFFATTSKETFETYWKKLTESEVIIFYYLPLQDFGLSDDLYIKMNARGKQLTSFENFKADLIGYIEQKAKEDKEWEKFLDTEHCIPIKLDTTWTDIFWKNRSEDNRIDEIYFAFFNRYFLNDFIANSENAEKCESDKIFKSLYGKSGDDSEVFYSIFDNYKWISLELLNELSNVLDRVYRLDKAQLAILNKFDFIPTYKEYRPVSTLTQAQRVKFFAIGAYFANGDFDETSFLRWMRVANNLIDNADIDNVPNMISHIKLIDELSKGSHSIYEHLTAENFSVQSNASKEQLQEEITKAKKILENTEWEAKIIEAESYAFFKGAIRFLFRNEDGSVDWSQFNIKFKTAKKYFDENGVKEEYRKDAKLTKIVLSYCDDFWKQIGSWTYNDKFIFGQSANCWKNNILLESIYSKSVHILLIGDKQNPMPKISQTDEQSVRSFGLLLNSDVLTNISDDYYIRSRDNQIYLYEWKSSKNYKNRILSWKQRDSLLYKLVKNNLIEISKELCPNKDCNYENEFYLIGYNIDFKYKNIEFAYCYDGYVYLSDTDINFDASSTTDTNKFIDALNKHIEQILQ